MAVYDDNHLAQLRVIDQLLARGFTSAHICDFFAAVRSGRDLADVLGLHGALSARAGEVAPSVVPLDVDVSTAEARRMVDSGVACLHGGELALCDPELVRIVARAPDPRQCLAVLVEVFASCQPGVAAAAQDVDALLEALGTPKAAGPPSPDYRELAAIVIARQLGEAVRRPVMRSTA